MDKVQFLAQRDEAKNRVAAMDDHDGYRERSLRTIMLALECGISMSSGVDTAVFDALVMIQDLCEIKFGHMQVMPRV